MGGKINYYKNERSFINIGRIKNKSGVNKTRTTWVPNHSKISTIKNYNILSLASCGTNDSTIDAYETRIGLLKLIKFINNIIYSYRLQLWHFESYSYKGY